MFAELLETVREGGAILRGQRKPSRRFEFRSSGIRAIRERTSLSQSEFARLMGVSVKTLQDQEQDRRQATGPASGFRRSLRQG
jgi:putative transcriptional regulator